MIQPLGHLGILGAVVDVHALLLLPGSLRGCHLSGERLHVGRDLGRSM